MTRRAPSCKAEMKAAGRGGRQGLQRRFHMVAMKNLRFSGWEELFEKRSAVIRDGAAASTRPWAAALTCLKKVGGHLAVMAWKTMTNGWTTSYRYHEEKKLECLFGCRGAEPRDDLRHYLVCPRLWGGLARVGVKAALVPGGPACASDRLCPVNAEEVKMLAVTFLTYHGLKHSHVEHISHCKAMGRVREVEDMAASLMRMHARDAGLQLEAA